MNVLVLSAGRRVELIQLLKKANGLRNKDARIYAADANSLSPALYFADGYVLLPRVDQPNYLTELVNSIKTLKVDIVLPTIDTELPFLSSQNKFIEANTNASVIISSENTVTTFQNKITTHIELSKKGFRVPPVQMKPSLNFPIFAKPVQGSSSIGAQVIHSIEELRCLENKYGEMILQDFIQGEEFTIDCLVDSKGRPLWVVPRKRLATRSGEILKGKVVKDNALENLCFELINEFRFFGPVTIQVIRKDGLDYVIEINPRVGGGLPLSIYAGADILGSLIDMMNGKQLDYSNSYDGGRTFLRYDQTVEYLNHD